MAQSAIVYEIFAFSGNPMRWAGPRSGVAQDIVQRLSEISAVFIQQSIRLISLSVKAVSGTGNGPVGGRQAARPRKEIRWKGGYFYEFFHRKCPLCPLESVFWVRFGVDRSSLLMFSMQLSKGVELPKYLHLTASRLNSGKDCGRIVRDRGK